MNKKEILIILLIICCIFSLQAVAASSDSNTDDSVVLTAQSNVSAYSLPNSNDQLHEGSVNADSFSQLQSDISVGGTVTLNKNYTYDSSKDSGLVKGITIPTTVTKIDGQGKVIINGSNLARAFIVPEGHTITLTGITFINCNATVMPNGMQAGHGGAIFAKGVVNIDNCKFIDNTATNANGGAVFINGIGSTITNSYFEGNRAIKNPNNMQTGVGGSVFLNGSSVTISHSTFIKNMAGMNAGAIGSSGNRITNVNIRNCTINNNTANGSAGGVGMQSSNFHISDSTFKYNEAKGLFTAYPGNGGGLVMRGWDSYAYNCTFINNTAKQHGGAVFLTNTSYNPLNNNTGFVLSTFINNTAGSNGGAVDWSAGATHGYIRDSTFVNNTAKRSGGAVHWSGHYGTVTNSTFTNNNATGEVTSVIGGILGGGDGGAIVWVGSHGIINGNSTFTNNHANVRGGAIFLHGNSTENCTNLTIDSSTFNDNVAGINGGAVDFNRGAHDGVISNSTFNNNIANRSAGAVFWFGTNGIIRNSNFTNNKALGIAQYNDSYGNLTYGGYGGAVMWTGSNGTAINCRFEDNYAQYNAATNSGGRGGAVYLQGSDEGNGTNTTFDKCVFINNTAGTNGGAIDWHEGAGEGAIRNSVFENNTAYANGGAVYWRGHNGEIIGSNFTNNTAKGTHTGSYGNIGDGGAIFWAGINGTVENSRFIVNNAQLNNATYHVGGRGGAVYLERCEHGNKNTTFRNVYFKDNVAGTNGGAIDWHAGAEDGLIDNGTFINNTARRNGGAIFWHGYNGTVKNSRFSNNRATGEAHEYDMDLTYDDVIVVKQLPHIGEKGKLYVINKTLSSTVGHFESWVNGTDNKWHKLDEVNISLSESIISPVDWAIDQYFGGDGGTILWSGDLGLVYNCTFVDSNSARRGGGAYMTGSDYVTYNLCNFTNCTSGTNGGGVDWLAGANYGHIYNCVFNNTRAARSAGAIYYDGDYGRMENITIINTTSYGGSLKTSKDGKVKYAGWDSSHWDTNTTGGDAGAIMFTGDHIIVYNVTFTNCTTVGRGGAVFLQDNHNVTFDLCKFENNRALGIANNTWSNYKSNRNDSVNSTKIDYKLTGHGGAVAFDVGASECDITNSVFINNYARRDGGAINFATGSLNNTVEYSNFTNNSCGDDGGAINWEGDLGHVIHIICYNNTAVAYNDEVTGASTSKGGIICLTGNNVTIANSKFELGAVLFKAGKLNETDGGALFVTGDYSTISNSTFIDCTAPNKAGAIMVIGEHTTIEDSLFMRNRAGGPTAGQGGAIYWQGNHGKIHNMTGLINIAVGGSGDTKGGNIFISGSDVVIEESVFNMTSAAYGGSIYIEGDNATLDNVSSMMTFARHGGAIFVEGNNASILNSDIKMSNATSANGIDGEGGAVYIQGNHSLINNTSISMSNSDENGGALYVSGDYGRLYNSNFTKNFAGDDGGAINWIGSHGIMENINCTMNNGRSTHGNSNGGTISLNGNNVTISKSYFALTSAKIAGGAIFITGNNVNVTDSAFEKCNVSLTATEPGKAYTTGGGSIYILGNNSYLSNCSFERSNARQGGVIYVQGHNATLDGMKTDYTFATLGGGAIYVAGSNSTISNSSFVRCNSTQTDGGSIYVDGINAEILTSNFTMCYAQRNGGGIYISGFHATIEGSTFSLNNATNSGGAIYVQGNLASIIDSNFLMSSAIKGDGGAIYVGGTNTTISGANSTMTQAVAGYGGIIYVNGANTIINNSVLSHSHSAKEGGAVYIKGDDSKIIDSNISYTTSSYDGGAVYIDAKYASIEDSHFAMNNATNAGGAIYINGISANVKNSTFNLTFARLSPTGYSTTNLGGAIYIKGDHANISDSKFANSFSYRGGMIYLQGSYCNVTNSSFENGYTSWDGGAIFATGSYSNVYNSNFTNNVAKMDGGAIFWYGGKESTNNVVDGCIFTGNAAYPPSGTIQNVRTTRGGGAIYWSEGQKYGVVRNSQFINNSVHAAEKADGGAILWDKANIEATIDNCTFDGNYITTSATIKDKPWVQGGAIYARPDGGKLVINNSEFRNCWSIREAGALYLDSSNTLGIYVLNTKFINNTAKGVLATDADNDKGGGGAMIKGTKNVWFINTTFINNTANFGGGLTVWKLNANSVYLINSTFDGNKATGGKLSSNSGGSIYGASSFNIENVTISNSFAAEKGGGIYFTNVDVNYKNLTFINNTAEQGGGLYWLRATEIEGMKFINNTATQQGGAMYLPVAQTIINNEFIGNKANEGGAIYVYATGSTIQYNNFTNNSANMGGAIYAPKLNNHYVDISHCAFDGNNASYGGAIYNAFNGNSNFPISDCTFIRNTAKFDGGAVYLATTGHYITSCTFESNNAQNGGSLYVIPDITANVRDSTFVSSHADNGGAIYYGGKSTGLTIYNDTFRKNSAVYNGAAVYYVVVENSIECVYRDFNNFDGIGHIDPNTHRTDVYTNGTSTHFIFTSLFENNYDYILKVITDSSFESPVITVIVDSPRNLNRKDIYAVINLTNSTTGQLIQQGIITPDNFYEHYNDHEGEKFLYATFTGLITNQTYNVTVGFSSADYLYKVNSTQDTAHGDPIGDFTLLQRWIEGNITNGKYEIHLTRTMRFTPYYNNDTSYPLDTKCMNLTNIIKPFTIYGDGWSIDARGFSRIFNITAANVTFVDVEFANGNASGKFGDKVDKGGALYWAGVNGTLIDCNFYTNNATIGGGIYYDYTATNAKIYNTSFRANNAVTRGGAIDCNSPGMELINTTFVSNTAYVGAALCREVNATGGHGFNNTFRDNHAEYAGAALAWVNASSIHIDTYYFYDNTAGFSGGAIYVGEGSGNCEIINCLFDNNYVDNSTDGHGGAIEWYAEKGLVDNSIFTNNHAYDGGAIYVGSDSGKINITKSTFKDNYALAAGGAVSLSASSITINQSNFYNNKALEGGALYVGGKGETNYVYNSVFEGNNATDGNGGAINWMASSGTIVNSNLTNNNAYYGGGIYFGGLSNESIITRCIFTDNHAKYNGGAIDCNASKMYLTHTIFDGNYAQFGAALCREVNAQKGSGENNTFKNNHAFVSGAALGWMTSVGITITDYKFINNSADVSGGAIYVSPGSHNCSIIDSYFEDNFVTNRTVGVDSFSWDSWDHNTMFYRLQGTYNMSLVNKTIIYPTETLYYYLVGTYPEDLGVGGAVNILAENATIQNSNFTRNTARLGGGIYVGADSGNTVINVSVWRENVAYERGGAINLHASGVHIDDGEFYNNVAVNGSAVYVGGVGTENKIHESLFDGNIATGYGAGVYWIAQEGEIINSSFTRNSALYGGGIYLNGRSSNTNITNTTFRYNNATKNGGAIECNAENIGIYNLTFEHNYAGEYGAALCRESGARYGHGDHNVFNYNHAGIAGAALAWMGVQNIHIDYYNFTGNTANQRGAAIYVGNDSDFCIVEHCIFTGNNVTNDTLGIGGAIDINADNSTVIHSIFTDNHASVGGAISAGEESGFTKINNVTFTRNGATIDGGAINLRATGVSVNDTRFYSNTAGRHGGALMVGGTGKNNTIYYSVFEKNVAGDHGGAIDWLAAAGDIFYSNFTANEAVYGGGIYLNGISSQSRIFNVIFDANRATKNGGAIDCNASMMGLNNTRFTNNYAGEYGAALCREANATGGFGGNNSFIKNHADIAGAALAWLGVDGININNYTFINNTAFKSGGAIYVRGDSPNCKVRNSYFDTNYITDVKNGQGGAIDWVGPNGLIANTTFIDSIAVNGGTIFAGVNSTNITIFNSSFVSSRALGDGGAIALYSDNAKITYSNFTFSLALISGGAISGHNNYNTTIDYCIFDYGMGAGYIDSSLKAFGEGGAIHWENATDLNISNSKFLNLRSNANGGSISAVNCNDSTLYNLTFNNEVSSLNGGSISWINSTNLTFDSLKVNKSKAFENGGAFYLIGVNDTTIKNSIFYDVKTPDGNGGGIYVDGNVTVQNSTFANYEASIDYGGALYFNGGISTVIDSNFTGRDAIWVYRPATVYLTNNNITGPNPNKNMTYLERDYNSKYNPVDYSVWNDGILYLDKNSFDYVIFNNGTIMTQTYLDMLNNSTYEVEWNQTFTFFANITDDNDNTIISVHTLGTYNDHPEYDAGAKYNLTYNRWVSPAFIQDVFLLSGNDTGLAKCSYRNGTLKVKMQPIMKITKSEEVYENITFTAEIIIPYDGVNSNYTINKNEQVHFVIGGKDYYGNISCVSSDNKHWIIAYANITLNHMHTGTYTVTATYDGDDYHFGVTNYTTVVLKARPICIIIEVADIYYNQTLICNVTTNATNTKNGYIWLRINGKEVASPVKLEKNGTKVVYIPESVYGSIINTTGEYTMSVMFSNDTYYDYQINFTTFHVKKFDTNITVNVTTPIVHNQNEIINVTVNETATGFVKITIPGYGYIIEEIDHGKAQFNISDLAVGEYINCTIEYYGDDFFNGNSTNVTFTVIPASDYILDVKVDNITYGENATVRVLVPTYATGNVTIYVDGKKVGTVNITNGTASLSNITGLAGGVHIVNVTYNGDAEHYPKDKNGTEFTVYQTKDWSMTINGDYKPYGENTTITITVPSDVRAKNVTIMIDGVSYVRDVIGNVATLTLNNLSAGRHEANVSYAGNANYTYKLQKFFPDIPQADPTLIITRVNGDVIVTIPENATGNISVFINGKTYENKTVNGVATFKDVLHIGFNYVTASYPGDKNYTKEFNMTTFEIVKTGTDLTVVATPTSILGNNVLITVTMVNVTAGKVLIEVNNYNYTVDINSNGIATLELALPVGTYTPKAYYLGDVEHAASNKTGNAFEVIDKITPEITITVPSDLKVGDIVNITVTSNGYNLTVWIDGVKQTIVNGNITYTVPSDGIHTIFANTTENATHYSANKTVVFEAVKNNATLIISDINVVHVGDQVIITVTPTTDGAITIKVDDVVINNGDAFTPNLEGKYTITVESAETVKYNAGFNSTVFTVNKRISQINVTATGNAVGNNATITVQVQRNATGYVTVNVNGTNYTIKLNSTGAGSINITGLGNGTYYVHATYIGDNQYLLSTNVTETFEMTKLNTEMDITVQDITYGQAANITVTITPGATGYITIRINETKSITLPIVEGKVNWVVEGLGADNYTVYANYSGDGKYLINNTNKVNESFEVRKADPKLDIVSFNCVVYEEGKIEISINPETAGEKLNITVGDFEYKNIEIPAGGKLTFDIPNALNEFKDYNVTVKYAGNANFTNATFKSAYHTTKITTYGINVTGMNITVGDDEIITVEVPNHVDDVVIWVNGESFRNTSFSGNKATFNITHLKQGIYTVTATVNDTEFEHKNFTSIFTVNKTSVPMNITIFNNASIYVGDTVKVVVSVPKDVTENVTIEINNIRLTNVTVNGNATFYVPSITYGNKTVVAAYVGDDKYYYNSTTANFTVNKRASQVEVTVVSPINVGDSTKVTVKVPANATGYVVVNVNGNNFTVNLTGGQGSVEIAGLKNTTYKVTATYLGDDQYLSSINNTTVIKANKVASTINLTAARNGIIPNGTNMNITVKVPVDATGKVELTLLNGTKVVKTYTIYVNDGEGILHIYTPEVGLYNVTARYLGDDKYLSSENTTSFEVYSTGGKLTVSAQNVNVDTNATVQVTIIGEHDGEVTIIVLNETGEIVRKNVTITPGSEISRASLTLPLLEAGEYDIVAVFREIDGTKTTVHEGTGSFKVSKIPSEIRIVKIDNTTVGNDVIIYLGIDLDEHARFGNITLLVNGHEYNTTVDNLEVHIPNLNATDYELEVTYHGNHWYDASSAHSRFTVVKNPISFVIEVPESKVGEIEHITVILNESDATGIILLDVDGKHLYANVSSHVAKFNITGLKAGEHQINATYLGDYKYLANSTTAVLKITRTDTEASVKGTNITYGDDELIKFETAQNITSAVKVEIDGVNYTAFISEGKGNLTVRGLAAGKHNITLYVPQTEKYTAATAKANFTVSKGSADLSIEIANVTYGEITTVNVYVNATGNVTFEVEGMDPVTVDIVNGVASLPLSGLGAGNYTVKATYNGNANVTTKEIESEFEVEKADPVITVEVKDIAYGDVEYIVITSNAPGNVTVNINGVTKVVELTLENGRTAVLMASRWSVPEYNGKADVEVKNLETGKYTVDVTYNGNENYNKATETAVFNVGKQNTTVDVEVEPSIKVGETQVINITVGNVNATGNVTINIDGVNYTAELANGRANFTTPKLAAGNHTVNVIYDGDKNLTGNWTSAIFEVSKHDSEVTLDVTLDGDTAIINVNAPSDVTRPVLVDVDGTGYYVNITDGKGQLVIPGISGGNHTVTARYLGDDKYSPSQKATKSFEVESVPSTVSVKVDNITYGDKAVVEVTVPTDATGNVTVTIGNKTYTVPVSGGKGVLVVPGLEAGNYTVEAKYNGDDKYESSTNSTALEVSKVKVTPEDVKVIDQGNGTVVVVVPENATGNVTVKVGDKEYNATVVNGTAVITLDNSTPGTHEVEVIYSGDDNHDGVGVKANVTAPKRDAPIEIEVGEAKEGEPVEITVTVPENATGNVTISVEGKDYTAPIKDGKATFTVPELTDGDKTIAVGYEGDDNYAANNTVGNFTVEKAPVEPDMKVVDYGNGTVVVVVGDNATGNVTVKVDGKEYNATVVNGTAVVTIDGNVTPGTHEVEIVYSGDDTHNATSTTTNITGPKYETPIEIEVGEAKEGEPVEITVTVPEDATGNVTISVDGKDYTAPIKDGKATFTVPELTDGDKTIAVGYGGDDNYVANSTVGNFTVEKAPIKPDVKVIDQGNGTVVVVVGDNATGNVTVKVDGKEYNATVVNGTAVVTIDNNVTPGTHEVEIVYSGDDTHNATSTTTNITGPKYETPIEIDVGEAKEGEPVEITVTVPADATGDVVVSVGGKNYTAPVKDGKAVVSVDGLTPGDHTVAVEYIGDDNYVANYTIDNLTVEKAKETPDMKIIDSGNGTIAVVVGDNATGNVTVKVGDKEYTVPVENGTAIINLDDDVEPGEHDVEIIYSGDDTHDSASINTTVTGPMGDTPLDVTVENIKVGDSEVIVVNVPQKATGSITIEIDGETYTAPIENGKATFTVDGLKEGKKSVFVKYDGDDKYKANTTTAQFSVDKVTTEVQATIEDIEVGDNLKVTVKLPDDATGQVLIDIDGVGYYVNITNGTGVAEIPRLGSGNYSVNVTYTGDDKYAGSSTTKSFSVEKVESFVIPMASNIWVGENENIKLIVPSDATGNVTVIIDGEEYNFNLDDGTLGAVEGAGKYTVAISGGNGELVISGLPKGEYYVSVRYNGDEKYLPATNTTIFTVSKIDTTMDVIDQGNGTVLVVLPSDATGNVTVKVGDDTYTVKVENGTAVIKLDETKPGVHKIDVSYSGDNNYASKNAESTVDIPKSDAPMTISSEDIEVGDNEVITIDLPGKTTGTVTVEIDGKTYTGEIKDGKAQISIPDLTAGNKTAIVTYDGDDYFKSNSTAVKFEVTKVEPTKKVAPKDITVGKDEVITVSVPSDATGQVLVEINGVGYYADIVNGKAKVVIPKLDAGKYTAKVTYVGDAKYDGFTDIVKFTVEKAKSSMSATADEVKVGEDSTITIDLPSDATGTVTVTIDGKKYTTEVVNGKAVIKVHGLPAGKYNAIVVYSGDAKYNSTTSMVEVVVDGNNNGTPDNGGKHEIALDVGEGVSLSDYPTGNPLWILLLVLLAIGSNEIRRRFRK